MAAELLAVGWFGVSEVAGYYGSEGDVLFVGSIFCQVKGIETGHVCFL